MRLILIAAVVLFVLFGCTDSKSLPRCADIGCPTAVLCTRAGACTCDGVACERGDAGIDANATAPAAFATGAVADEVDAGEHGER